MSDKWQAIQEFWEGFDIPAYDENSVPDDATAPYITYTAQVASFEAPLLLTGSIWYRSTNWRDVSRKADEIARSLNKLIRLDDNGYLWLTRGSPFAQRMADTDDTVKRVYINIMAEFFARY